jgi:hypothetical protein
MKTIVAAFLLIIAFGITVSNAQHLEKVWETTTELKTPESVLYDTERDIIYVSNINGNPAEADGNGFISILESNGKVKNLKWISGLNAPKGMAIYKTSLFVSDIKQLVEIDIESGKILHKYDAPNAVFLNDVSVYKGIVFVSDTRTAKIHALQNGEFKVWMEGKPLENPNGLMVENDNLYIGDNNIYKVDIATRKIETLIEDAGGVDGLEKNRSGDFIFSNWPGRIYINKDGKNIKLHDSTAEKLNTADLDFDLKHDLVLVPTFF